MWWKAEKRCSIPNRHKPKARNVQGVGLALQPLKLRLLTNEPRCESAWARFLLAGGVDCWSVLLLRVSTPPAQRVRLFRWPYLFDDPICRKTSNPRSIVSVLAA